MRKFEQLSYEEVKDLHDIVEYVTSEFIHCSSTYIILLKELKEEKELRG